MSIFLFQAPKLQDVLQKIVWIREKEKRNQAVSHIENNSDEKQHLHG